MGALGLPDELRIHPQVRTLFGFPDRRLGEHVERAYQALALNETREDFVLLFFLSCIEVTFEDRTVASLNRQKREGRKDRYFDKCNALFVLFLYLTPLQCWFSGCHADCGGGYRRHDLADLTLTWMVVRINNALVFHRLTLAGASH